MVDEHKTDGIQTWPDSAFWRYSVDLYAKEGVEAACIALQDRRGIDVNLLLLAFWLASRGVALDHAGVGEIEAVIARFRAELVQPLRAVRRHLRGMQRAAEPSSIAESWPDQLERLRRRVAAAELDGEHLIQLALEQASVGLKAGSPQGAALAAVNLRLVAPFAEADRADLTLLFQRAFDDLSPADLSRALRGAGFS